MSDISTIQIEGVEYNIKDINARQKVENAIQSISVGGTVATKTNGNVSLPAYPSKASDVGLGNVGNFKAVSTVANQGLTETEKANARSNIGAGASSFSGNYNDLTNKPTIPTNNNQLTNGAGYTKNTGTVTSVSVTLNGSNKGTITTSGTINLGTLSKGDVGLDNVDNTADSNKTVSKANYANLTNLNSFCLRNIKVGEDSVPSTLETGTIYLQYE